MNRTLQNSLYTAGGLILGGLITFGVLRNNPHMVSKPGPVAEAPRTEKDFYSDIYKREQDLLGRFDNMFDRGYFKNRDGFEGLKQFRKDMESYFGATERETPLLTNPFDTWFTHRFGGGTLQDIQRREDAQFVYYDIKVSDLKSTTISTSVRGGYVTISGKTEQKSGKNETESIFESSFERILPVPENVDADRMETVTQGDTVTLKFPKLTT